MDTITNETNGQKIPYSTHTFSQDKVNALFVNNSQQLKQLLPNELTNEKLEGGITTMNVRNFNINTERILSLETDFYHVLTYLVTKDDVEGVINLTFYSWDYKNYFPVVTYYDVDETDVANYYKGIPFATSKVKYINTDFDYVSTLSKFTTNGIDINDPCVKIYEEIVDIKCAEKRHCVGMDCIYAGGPGAASQQYYVIIDVSDCDDSGGGGSPGGGSPGGGSPGSGSPGGGYPIFEQPGTGNPGYPGYLDPGYQTPGMGFPGGGGGVANPGDIRFPIKGIPALINFPPPPNQKNCEQLKNWSNQQNYQLNSLSERTLDAFESGFVYRKTGTNTTSGTAIGHLANNPDRIKMPAGGTVIGINHTHPDKNIVTNGGRALPIFSAADLLGLIGLADRFGNQNEINYNDFFVALTVNQYTYAVKFPNLTSTEFTNNYLPFLETENKTKFIQKINYHLDKLMADINNVSANQYEEALLKGLAESGLKIEVYKTNNNDGNFGGDWSQLYLDNSLKGNKVKENSYSTFKIIR